MLEKLQDDYKLLLKDDIEFFHVPFLLKLEYVDRFMKRYGLDLLVREEQLKDGQIKYVVANEDGDAIGNIELSNNNHLCMRIDKTDDNQIKTTDYLDIGIDYFDACISNSINEDEICYIYFNDMGIVQNDGTVKKYETYSIKDRFKEACANLVSEIQLIENKEKVYTIIK